MLADRFGVKDGFDPEWATDPQIPGASHGIGEHARNLIAKAACIMGGFNRYRS